MSRVWRVGTLKRVAVPVGWHASVGFGLRAAMPGLGAAFPAGARRRGAPPQ